MCKHIKKTSHILKTKPYFYKLGNECLNQYETTL